MCSSYSVLLFEAKREAGAKPAWNRRCKRLSPLLVGESQSLRSSWEGRAWTKENSNKRKPEDLHKNDYAVVIVRHMRGNSTVANFLPRFFIVLPKEVKVKG